MVPALEDMGYRLLMNEMVPLEREQARIYLAGVDDAHYYKVHNLHRAGDDIPAGGISLLLSHTPEIWREAAHAGYDMFLCGHTHGGQIWPQHLLLATLGYDAISGLHSAVLWAAASTPALGLAPVKYECTSSTKRLSCAMSPV